MIRKIPSILVILVILVGLTLARSAAAGPHKVLVLPLDGDAAPELRAKYSASVQRLARTLDGKVTPGDVAFTDTATAIGCDPKTPKCAEDVRATLGVDELVYGTVTRQDGQVVVVVRRVAKGKPPREVSTTIEATAAPADAEPAILPLFQAAPGDPVTEDTVVIPDEQKPKETPAAGAPLSRNKVLGYAAVGGGATLVLISFALWSSAGGLKDDIEAHPVNDSDDFEELTALEDKASTRAWAGNVLFVVGLAVGGYGGYMLYREHKAQQTVITPAAAPGGAALMIGGVF